MKYTKEITDKLIADYKSQVPVAQIAADLDVPERSVIAKLSSLGVYQKKSYVNKRGEVPVKKSEHIERIAELLDVDEELLESLEKVNKTVLKLIEQKLAQTDPKPDQSHKSRTTVDLFELA
jgi:DNA-directed RNA polymerase specialized sigma subunit